MTRRIAIVGAGIAGLAAAREIAAAGHDVVLFDKGRSIGGRVATRRRDALAFDHGAQFFTVREPSFAEVIEPARAAGSIALWRGPFRTLTNGALGPDPRPGAQRFVGVPGMSALPRALAQGLDVTTGTRVDGLARNGDSWRLHTTELGANAANIHGAFDAVVLALPAAQAAALLHASNIDGPVADAARRLAPALAPCLCALVAFAEPLEDATGGMFVTDEALSFAAHDGGKPGRSGAATFVLHGTAAWSAAHFERAPLESSNALVAAFARALARPLPAVLHVEGHRWRYALADGDPAPSTHTFDETLQLALCGDAFTSGRVEGAFVSGRAAGLAIAR